MKERKCRGNGVEQAPTDWMTAVVRRPPPVTLRPYSARRKPTSNGHRAALIGFPVENAFIFAWTSILTPLFFKRQLQFGKKEMRILMVGLDAAGKTTILYKLTLGEGEFVKMISLRIFQNVQHVGRREGAIADRCLFYLFYLSLSMTPRSCHHDSYDWIQRRDC